MSEDLAGREVAITGRMASMSRQEAVRRLVEVGARYVSLPSERTDLLVLGQGGPPLGEDGRLTYSLRRARDLVQAGEPLEILREEAFLARLGLHERLEDIHRLYTTQQLSRILKVPVAQVRAWVRHGLITPTREVRRLLLFDFRQVSSARELVELARQGVSPGRLRTSLEQLQGWLGEGALPLAQLETLERDGDLVVRLADGRVADPDGQLRLAFGAAAAADAAEAGEAGEAAAAEPAGGPGSDAAASAGGPGANSVSHLRTPPLAADDDPLAWFGLGLAAEERGDHAAAVPAYERSLRLDPREETAFNLGNCLLALDRAHEAVTAYERATELDPEYVEAWNNLGVALADAGRGAEGCLALRRALALAPDYADAHYNLAETLAADGDVEAAREHWRAYLRQDPHSAWARELRERLARL